MTAAGSSYKGFRFPPEIISHCVWLYHRFPLSFRDVQELMLERGVDVSYETIRAWCDRFGQEYANQLRRRGPRPGDKWHLDEVFVQINGAQRYLWRAVDQHGNVLDILVRAPPGQTTTRPPSAADRHMQRVRQCRRTPVMPPAPPAAPPQGPALPYPTR
ncbi:MAG TPA: IS6 family transposase [Mycobacterium sp.]|nr:IS6 family transposase [Mycobacterium sp.]HUH69653.1 IS6 family transposase [Mycobacterium sp.]